MCQLPNQSVNDCVPFSGTITLRFRHQPDAQDPRPAGDKRVGSSRPLLERRHAVRDGPEFPGPAKQTCAQQCLTWRGLPGPTGRDHRRWFGLSRSAAGQRSSESVRGASGGVRLPMTPFAVPPAEPISSYPSVGGYQPISRARRVL
jgi:hypothetical protein